MSRIGVMKPHPDLIYENIRFLQYLSEPGCIQVVNPCPPVGLATLTVLVLQVPDAPLGIYNSASHVSPNNSLRKFIRSHALLKSHLLDLIGHAEMEKEIDSNRYY